MPKIKLLFVVQGKRFVSKGGLEVIESFSDLDKTKFDLTIITSTKDLSPRVISKIEGIECISVYEFNYTYAELEKIYASHHVLIQTTSDESFGLTILEALKAGLPIIGTNLYAISEMVENNKNGFLIDPKFFFFDKENKPNPDIWNNRKKTINNEDIVDMKIVNFIIDKVVYLENNRSELLKFSLESYKKSNEEPFSEEFICSEWNKLIKEVEK